MATITLGGREIAVSRPADLDQRVDRLAGVTPMELAAMLGAPAMLVVAILAITSDESLLAADLGAMIAGADVPALAAEVRAVLVPADGEHA